MHPVSLAVFRLFKKENKNCSLQSNIWLLYMYMAENSIWAQCPFSVSEAQLQLPLHFPSNQRFRPCEVNETNDRKDQRTAYGH